MFRKRLHSDALLAFAVSRCPALIRRAALHLVQ
jgi:hypothetical protein